MRVPTAQRLFLAAGIYGVIVVAPLLFLEERLGAENPPAVTHPEFYYGFVWVALAWQIVYLIMSRDPLRFRPMLFPAVVGKVGFALSVFLLYARGRLDAMSVGLASIDLALAASFAWVFFTLKGDEQIAGA